MMIAIFTRQQVLYPQITVLLKAEYSQDETTVTDTIEITINASCSAEALVTRNLEKTMQSKEKILYELQQALIYEKACSAIIKDLRNGKNTGISQPDLNKARNQVILARVFENTAEKFVETSVESLLVVADIFAPESPFIERLNNYLDSSSGDTGNAPGSDGQPTCGCADLTGDDFVDLNDFACFSSQWLQSCQ